MRAILNYPKIDNQKLDIVKQLIDSIADNPNSNCDYELRELNRITGKFYTAISFAEYWGWTDLDILAEKALLPEPPCIRNLNKDEMKEIVSIIKNSLISCDDNKAEYYMELLHKSLPFSDVYSYIKFEQDEETI